MKRKPAEIVCKSNYVDFKIYIDNKLHLAFKKDDYIGVQSWFEGSERRMYYIEYTFKDSEPIFTEYFELDTWVKILDLIDKNL